MKLTYRPEIDGLRAIAVGAVILYHAQITIFGHQPFKGGFIGVDIFFVISGYLITSIILKELVTTGSFSFKHFYERRVRRILPALLFVMLVSLPFAWMYLLPSSFVDFSKSILYSLGFSSNFYFHYSGQQYGAESGLLKPFLHTWSLSVEEQFYILFPIFLLVTFKYFRNYLIHILILGFVISLGLAEWTSRNYPSASFYFIHTRMWELLAGSILAYFEITFGHRSKNKILNLILPTLGLLLIGHSILFFNDRMFHLSLFTLSPIIGVCLIIWFSNKDELITKILSTKLFVGIGLISYSLYLWHYPIFAFARETDFAVGNILKKNFLALILIILSIFSYYLVEIPSRNKKYKFKIIFTLILITFSFLVISNMNIIFKKGYEDRMPKILKDHLLNKELSLYNIFGKCHNKKNGCKFNIYSNKKIYMIGDSTVAKLILNLDIQKLIKQKNYQIITSTHGSCLYFPEFNLINKYTKKVDKNCNNKYFKKLKKQLSKEEGSIVIIGGRLPVYLSNSLFNNLEGGVENNEDWGLKYVPVGKYKNIEYSFKKELIKISKKNQIILIYPVPEVGWNVIKRIWKQRSKLNQFNISTSFKVFKDRNAKSFDLLNSIQGNNVYRVYPHTLFCDTVIKNRCVTHDDKNIYYDDSIHTSQIGSKMINDLIMKEIEKIELKSN